MAKVGVSLTFPGAVHEAEKLWYDTGGWPAWVDGLRHVVAVEGDWPGVGSSVTWESGPAGRGRVRERVIAYQPLAGQSLEVEDDSIRGRQSVAFTPAEEDVAVDFTLEYAIKKRSIVSPLVDLLFIRRVMTASLRRTLARFGTELEALRR